MTIVNRADDLLVPLRNDSHEPIKRPAGILLCGGESRRMGRSKPWLPFGSETLLERVALRLSIAVDPLVIVAAPDQAIPVLPISAIMTNDDVGGQGPLQGFLAGLHALPPSAEWVYLSAVDLPFVEPGWIAKLAGLARDDDAVVPKDGRRLHPLAALYRRSPTLLAVDSLLKAGHRRVRDLLDTLNTRFIDTDTLRDVDPQLQTLRNLNTLDDYRAALDTLGIPFRDLVE